MKDILRKAKLTVAARLYNTPTWSEGVQHFGWQPNLDLLVNSVAYEYHELMHQVGANKNPGEEYYEISGKLIDPNFEPLPDRTVLAKRSQIEFVSDGFSENQTVLKIFTGRGHINLLVDQPISLVKELLKIEAVIIK